MSLLLQWDRSKMFYVTRSFHDRLFWKIGQHIFPVKIANTDITDQIACHGAHPPVQLTSTLLLLLFTDTIFCDFRNLINRKTRFPQKFPPTYQYLVHFWLSFSFFQLTSVLQWHTTAVLTAFASTATVHFRAFVKAASLEMARCAEQVLNLVWQDLYIRG